MRTLKPILFTALAGFLLLGLGTAARRPPQPTEEVEWLSLSEAYRRIAADPQNQKKVFIDVYTDWCGWCKRMEATTFHDPKIVEALRKNFYCVRLNAEQGDTIWLGNRFLTRPADSRTHDAALQLAAVNGRLMYPTLSFLDERFNLIQPLQGFQTPEALLPILVFIGDNHYRQGVTWEQFQQNWQR